MAKVKDIENFIFSKEDIIDVLINSPYRDQFVSNYNTLREQDSKRWCRGKKYAFQNSLVEAGYQYFAYIKFYVGNDNKKYALVAGKSGSKLVNKYAGCDLSFSRRPEDGNARRWLKDNRKKWCHTEILIIVTKSASKEESEKEALKIEKYLQSMFDLWGC